jgi:two-component system chemotaxis response regulator CheY
VDSIAPRKPRILIVDDDGDLLGLITAVLPSDAYIIAERDGIGGVSAFRQALLAGAPFNTVCMDLKMPGMDGVRALRAIRRVEGDYGQRFEHARIVMMSASRDRSTVQMALLAGADDYLGKPFTLDELLLRLRLDRFREAA